MIRVKEEQKTNFWIDYAEWLSLGAGILLLLAGFFFLVLPQFQALAELNQKAKEEQMVLFDSEAKLKSAQLILEKYQALQASEKDNLGKLDVLLPKEKNHEAVISNLSAIVLLNGLLINSVSVAPQDKKVDGSPMPANLGAIKISLDLIGVDYQALKNVLTAIERNLRLLDVVAVKFSPKDASAQLEIIAYYLNGQTL